MSKKLIGMIIAIVLLLSLSLPAFAQETEAEEEPVQTEEAVELFFLEISTPEEFLEFAENCRLDSYSAGLVVTLKQDIDLSGTDFSCVPTFSGVFDGGGNRITGLELTGEGSYQGLFRYLTGTATVKDLTVEGTVAPGGSASAVGGFAGRNDGTIQNCVAVVQVSGSSYVGGIAGINGVSGLIEESSVRGQVDGAHFVGGIAGENKGVVRSCVNCAAINNSAKQNTVELSEITLETITDSEASNTATDIGGIAGLSTGLIRNSENRGEVGYPHMGYNVGGIAGTQSGHIADCVNFAGVQGRKEVGGIVGQMEPISYVEFSEDTLQILKEQLGTMSGLVDKAAVNAGGSAGAMSGQIGALKNQANTAWEAVETLLTIDKTDKDGIIAAQNSLTGALGQMPGTVNNIAGAAQAMVGGLSRDFKIISEHIAVMSETINSASEDMGGSLTDISDMDTSAVVAGKVLRCVNRGSVQGDLNIGGIAGAMGFENDMDILEDWESIGQESLNFDSKIRAVILSCDNHGTVTGGKQHIGGIVGWQSLGLVRSSLNDGKVDGTGADYVGGISGFSLGYIRYCGAKCEILGNTCVGGIAGTGNVATNSLSAVQILGATEKLGAILGIRQEGNAQQEQPLADNFYLPLDGDIGAVDGISYDGQAQPLSLEEFLNQERLPSMFRRVTVRFVFENAEAKEVILVPGQGLSPEDIPQVPEKRGMSGEWENLENTNLSEILHDLTFTLRYEDHAISISSSAQEQGRPILLAEGLFGLDARLDVAESVYTPSLAEDETLIGCWEPVLTGEARADVIRFLVPGEEATDLLRIYVRDDNGTWRQEQGSISGSYIVFPWQEGDASFALVRGAADYTLWYIGAAAGAAVLLAIIIATAVRRKKKSAKEEPEV